MVPSKCRPGRGPRAAPAPVNNCGLQLVIQTSSITDKSKPFDFRINKEQSSFHTKLLQHDLEKNYTGRQGEQRVLSPLVRNKQIYLPVPSSLTELSGLELKQNTGSLSGFGESSIHTPAKSRSRQSSHSISSHTSDNIHFGSSSSITFPVLQRTAEEKILNSDRLTLERQKLTVCPIIDGEDHLRLLNFQHNFITRIQNISNLQHLVFLDLYDNQIEEISGLSTLRSLRVLLLGKNRIKKITNLENLINLDVLDLHGNQSEKSKGEVSSLSVKTPQLGCELSEHKDGRGAGHGPVLLRSQQLAGSEWPPRTGTAARLEHHQQHVACWMEIELLQQHLKASQEQLLEAKASLSLAQTRHALQLQQAKAQMNNMVPKKQFEQLQISLREEQCKAQQLQEDLHRQAEQTCRQLVRTQEEHKCLLQTAVEQAEGLEHNLRSAEAVLAERVAQLRDAQAQLSRNKLLIEELREENRGFAMALQAAELKQKSTEEKNQLLEEQASALKQLITKITPVSLSG